MCVHGSVLKLLHRLAVKTLVDKSCLGIIDDGCPELENFITILEHIFNHRLKRKYLVKAWFKILSLSKTVLIILLQVNSCSEGFIPH